MPERPASVPSDRGVGAQGPDDAGADAGPDHAQVAFHPPLLLLFALALGFVARWLVPVRLSPSGFPGAVGPALSGLAFALFGWAVYTMRRRGASIPIREPTTVLVVAGPYRFSRNPIYLSMLLLLIGLGVWSNSAWFVLMAALAAGLFYWGVVSREERYLERKFGTAYTAYRQRVRRWI